MGPLADRVTGDAAGAARRGGEAWLFLLAFPCALLLLLFFLLPIGELVVRSFAGHPTGLQHYRQVFADTVYQGVFLNSLKISLLVATVCTLLGYPVGVVLGSAKGTWRLTLTVMVYVPFLTSILVRSFSWIVILQKNGLVNWLLQAGGFVREPLPLVYNRLGVVIGMTHVLLPFTIYCVATALRRVEPQILWAAESLGARPAAVFRRIILPLSMPGVVIGFGLVFLLALGFYITPALLGGPADLMVSQLIDEQITRFGNWGLAAALSVILVVVTLGLLSAVAWLGYPHLRRFSGIRP
ncbi:MAG: ABC transporter permease [Acidobacteriota bacterium]|nr:MAG: ABC transporter permease [Acidobacteriota bacterium]